MKGGGRGQARGARKRIVRSPRMRGLRSSPAAVPAASWPEGCGPARPQGPGRPGPPCSTPHGGGGGAPPPAWTFRPHALPAPAVGP